MQLKLSDDISMIQKSIKNNLTEGTLKKNNKS